MIFIIAPQITAAYPFFQQTTPASSVPSEMPKPVLQLVPLVAKVGGNNDGVSNPIATSNTAAASESGTNQPSISGTTAVSQPVNSGMSLSKLIYFEPKLPKKLSESRISKHQSS